MIFSREKELNFAKLVKEATACAQCARMANSVHVIGPASGSLDARIFIIGEAPGRLGADASAIPFHGDKAGDNFEALLEQVGLNRNDCFITNAAICNPKDENGNNATPTRLELSNCSQYLKRQIDLVNPAIVVTLGAQALNALKLIEDHSVELSTGVRKLWSWYGCSLIALYHPGQRAMIHRSFFNQLTDYRFLAENFSRLTKRRTQSDGRPTSETIARIAEKIASEPTGVSYFALHKLFYLAEYEFYRRTRRRMTAAYIVRQKEGPYIFEMHIKKLKKAIRNLEVWSDRNRLMLRAKPVRTLFEQAGGIDNELVDVIEHVLNKYSKFSDADLKRVVYLTQPMRQVLHKEKGFGQNMFNRAIDFSSIEAG